MSNIDATFILGNWKRLLTIMMVMMIVISLTLSFASVVIFINSGDSKVLIRMAIGISAPIIIGIVLFVELFNIYPYSINSDPGGFVISRWPYKKEFKYTGICELLSNDDHLIFTQDDVLYSFWIHSLRGRIKVKSIINEYQAYSTRSQG